MPNAVVHILIPIILIDIIRDYFLKKKFPRYIVLIGGIAGVLPDIDMPLSWILGRNIHGTFTHTIIFAMIFLLISFILHFTNKNEKKNHYSLISFIIFIGIIMHLALDCSIGGYNFYWPFSDVNYCIAIIPKFAISGLDAILLVLWLVHEEIKHKIIDYI